MKPLFVANRSYVVVVFIENESNFYPQKSAWSVLTVRVCDSVSLKVYFKRLVML